MNALRDEATLSVVTSFTGEFRWLSNFWPCRVWFGELDGEMIEWSTVEHAYQAAKSATDAGVAAILACATPGEAKRAGKHVRLRHDWDDVKVDVMRSLLEQKFGPRNPDLRSRLVALDGRVLVEGNRWHDNFWGVCGCKKCADKQPGRNQLGLLLMEVRDNLLKKSKEAAR